MGHSLRCATGLARSPWTGRAACRGFGKAAALKRGLCFQPAVPPTNARGVSRLNQSAAGTRVPLERTPVNAKRRGCAGHVARNGPLGPYLSERLVSVVRKTLLKTSIPDRRDRRRSAPQEHLGRRACGEHRRCARGAACRCRYHRTWCTAHRGDNRAIP